jgi:preprotein translocase subunit SecA
VLASVLEGACHGGTAPADLGAAEVSHAFLDHLPSLDLPPARRDAVPDLVAAFLGDLEDAGRLADGRSLAAQVRASASGFRDRAAGRAPDLTRKAPKVGRNDPCPCGSGKKYKQCCLRALGG